MVAVHARTMLEVMCLSLSSRRLERCYYPQAERAAEQLALQIYPELSKTQVE
jgi:hypothetical protein